MNKIKLLTALMFTTAMSTAAFTMDLDILSDDEGGSASVANLTETKQEDTEYLSDMEDAPGQQRSGRVESEDQGNLGEEDGDDLSDMEDAPRQQRSGPVKREEADTAHLEPLYDILRPTSEKAAAFMSATLDNTPMGAMNLLASFVNTAIETFNDTQKMIQEKDAEILTLKSKPVSAKETAKIATLTQALTESKDEVSDLQDKLNARLELEKDIANLQKELAAQQNLTSEATARFESLKTACTVAKTEVEASAANKTALNLAVFNDVFDLITPPAPAATYVTYTTSDGKSPKISDARLSTLRAFVVAQATGFAKVAATRLSDADIVAKFTVAQIKEITSKK